MNKLFDKFGKEIAVLVVLLSVLIMGYIIYELALTKEKVASSFVANAKEKTHHELDRFFIPIENQLLTTAQQLSLRDIHQLDAHKIKRLLLPIIDNYQQITAINLESEKGLDFDIIRNNTEKNYFISYLDATGKKPVVSQANYNYFLNDVFVDTHKIDARFKSIARKSRTDFNQPTNLKVKWLQPHILASTQKPGVSAIITWENNSENKPLVSLLLDIELDNISKFIQSLVPTPNGHVTLLSQDKKTVIGIPRNNTIKEEERYSQLFTIEDLGNPILHYVSKEAKSPKPFSWRNKGLKWWGALQAIDLSEITTLYIVTALPEKDFLKEINESQQLLIGGFFGISLLTLLILRSHTVQRKQKQKLYFQNIEIKEKNDIIEQKNEEILASIQYAKRIQQAMLPPNELIKKILPESFVLYLPKDIVAGDFYWIEEANDLLYIAAADCTGHGVPGAMVSVLCHNALSRCAKEFKMTNPAEILDKSKQIILEEFSQSNEAVNDGMDISLAVWDKKSNAIYWAGANCPLWLVRKNNGKANLESIKPDKQPVGNFITNFPFTSHLIKLNEGDNIYLFSDGFQDQFGGPQNKKYKVGQLKKLILANAHLNMEEQKDIFLAEFQNWKGTGEQVDDVCLIGVTITTPL